jgi:hypothetical protein
MYRTLMFLLSSVLELFSIKVQFMMGSYRGHDSARDTGRWTSTPRKRKTHDMSDSNNDDQYSEDESNYSGYPQDPSAFLNTFGGYDSDEREESEEDQGKFTSVCFEYLNFSWGRHCFFKRAKLGTDCDLFGLL